MKEKGKRRKRISKAGLQHENKSAKFAVHFNKLGFHQFIIIILALMIGLSGGIYVYAKYYSVKAREGIAIATGVYFSANYAASTTENGEFVESLVNSSYTGTNTSFTFEIRNYENNLLFNTNNVDIPYKVEFWIEDEIGDGVEYKVSWESGETTKESSLKKGEQVLIDAQSIEGGMARADQYAISINVSEGTKHSPVPIYVKVQTLEGALINRILKGKMLLSSADMAESYIESQQFLVPDETSDMAPEEKFEKLQSLSGFTYEIRTVGEVTTGDLTEELKLSWDPTVLQIDIFDEAYVEWLESAKKSAKEENPNADLDAIGPVEDATTHWYSITIKAMPYAAETIGFFRGSKFDEKAESGELNWKVLHESIKAEKM